MKRTFLASPVKASGTLPDLLESMKEELPEKSIKWVDPSTLHITVKFIGDTEDRLIPVISGELEEIGRDFRVKEGNLAGLDYFSAHGIPNVLYANIEGFDGVEDIARRIAVALERLGIPDEKRDFSPHLTLARIKFLSDKRRFLEMVRNYSDKVIQPVRMDRIVFYHSTLLPGGPVYKPLKTIRLEEE